MSGGMGVRLLILFCRMAAGGIRLKAGLGKLHSGWVANLGIEGSLGGEHAFRFYRGFLTHTVAQHAKFFSYLVVAGELSVGVCLLLGFLTRWAAYVGVLMMI